MDNSPFDDRDYVSGFKKSATAFIREAIAVGNISEHRGMEVLVGWVSGFASGRLCQMDEFKPWTQEHTRRTYDLSRLVISSSSSTS